MKLFRHILRSEWRRISLLWILWVVAAFASLALKQTFSTAGRDAWMVALAGLQGFELAGFFGGLFLLVTNPSAGSRHHFLAARPLSMTTLMGARAVLLAGAFLVPLALHEATLAWALSSNWRTTIDVAMSRCTSAMPLIVWLVAFATVAPNTGRGVSAIFATPFLLMMGMGFYFGPITDNLRAAHPNLWFPGQLSQPQLILWWWAAAAITATAAYCRRRLAWSQRTSTMACLALIPLTLGLIPFLPASPAARGLDETLVKDTLEPVRILTANWSVTRQRNHPGFVGLQHNATFPPTSVPASWDLRWSRGSATITGSQGAKPIQIPAMSPSSVGYYNDLGGLWAAARERLGEDVSLATQSHHGSSRSWTNFTSWLAETSPLLQEPFRVEYSLVGQVTTWRFLGDMPLDPSGTLKTPTLTISATALSPSPTGPRGLMVVSSWIETGFKKRPGELKGSRDHHLATMFWLPKARMLVSVDDRWSVKNQDTRLESLGSRVRSKSILYAGRNSYGKVPSNPPGVRPEDWEDARLLVFERVYLGSITKTGLREPLEIDRLPPVNYGSGPAQENKLSSEELNAILDRQTPLGPEADESAIRANISALLDAIANASRRPEPDSRFGNHMAQLVRTSPEIFLNAYPWMPSEVRFFLDRLLPTAIPESAKELVLEHAQHNPNAFLKLAIQCGWREEALGIAKRAGTTERLPRIAMPLLTRAEDPECADILVHQFAIEPRPHHWDDIVRVSEASEAIKRVARRHWEQWLPIYERGVVEDLDPLELGLAAGFREALNWIMNYAQAIQQSPQSESPDHWNLTHLVSNRFDLGEARQEINHDLQACLDWLLRRPVDAYQFNPITHLWTPKKHNTLP